MGPVSIEGYYDEAFAVPGLIQALMNAPDADAGIVACFDDTGLDAARIGRALSGGRHLRGGAGDGGPDRKTHRHRHHAAALDRAAGGTGAPLWLCGKGDVTACDVAVLDLEKPGSGAEAKLEAEIARALDKGAEAIVLGCAGMADLAQKLSRKFGVPVVDGVAAAVKQAEALAGLKLTTSRRGSYASPGVKKYDGILAPFAPKSRSRLIAGAP